MLSVRRSLFILALSMSLPFAAQSQAQAQAPVENPIEVPVNSPGIAFSPGNWTGDQNRAGSAYRQTWNPGAYFRVSWTTSNASPIATLHFDTSGYDKSYPAPTLTLNVDGAWTPHVACASEVALPNLKGAGNHVLTVYLSSSEQRDRWGSPAGSGKNVVKLTGVSLDSQAKPVAMPVASKWILEVGDSITEGIGTDNGGADNLGDYSYFVGQALQTRGIEYGVSACGWSGWLNPGDNPPGDVPGYYIVRGSKDGAGGSYDDGASRWNKIDGAHTLLDSRGHLSAYGAVGQEPAIITLNYGTNDSLHSTDPSDTLASITQSLSALRAAAPDAQIYVIMPFGQFAVPALHAGIDAYKKTHRKEKNLFVIDLGPGVANALNSNRYWGDLHPNQRAHAVFAAQILAAILPKLPAR